MSSVLTSTKKILLAITIFALFPVITSAQLVTTDPGNTATNVIDQVNGAIDLGLSSWDKAKEGGLDKVAWKIAQRLSEKAVNSVVNWAATGYKGKVFFVDDWGAEALNIGIESASEFAAYYKNIYQDEVNRARDGGGVNADFSGNCDLLPEDQQNECFYEKNQCGLIDLSADGGDSFGPAWELRNECFYNTGECILIEDDPSLNEQCLESVFNGITGDCSELSTVESRNQCYFKDEECDNIQTSYINDQGLAVAATNADLANRCYVKTNQCTRIVDVAERRSCESKRQATSNAGQTARYTLLYLAENAFTDRTSSLESSNISSGFSDDFAVVETASDGSKRAGGWDAWESIAVNSNNTPVGARFNAQQLITLSAEQAKEALQNELIRGGGLRDSTICTKYGYRIEGDESTKYCQREKVATPGNFVDNQIDQAVNTGLKNLGEVDEFGELVASSLLKLVGGIAQVEFKKLANTTQDFVDTRLDDNITGFQNIVDTSDGGDTDGGEFSTLGFQDANESYNWTNTPTTFDVQEFLDGAPVSASMAGFQLLGDESTPGIIRITNSGNGQQVGQAVVDTATQVQLPFSSDALAVESYSNLRLIRITDNPTGALPNSYYYYDSSNQNLYLAARKSPTEARLALEEQRGARDQVQGMISVLQEQDQILSDLAELTMNIDQQCILGPDLVGINQRLSNAITPAMEEYSEKPDKRRSVNILKDYAVRLAEKKMNDTETPEGRLASLYRPYVLENVRHKNMRSDIQRKLPEFYSLRSGVFQLGSEYEDSNTSEQDLQRVIGTLYQYNINGRIPTEELIEEEQAVREELLASLNRYKEGYADCSIEIQKPEFAQLRFYDDLQLLYCPFEWFFEGRSFGQFFTNPFGFGPQDSDFDANPYYLDFELGRLMGIDWDDVSVNADNNLIRSADSAGKVRKAESGGREYQITSLIINVNNTDTETHTSCVDYYRSSFVDYLPQLSY